MSPSWSRRIFTVHRLPCNMPAGFIHATNPGTLFRVLSPALQLSLLLALLCDWRPVAAARWRLAAALALAIVCDLITSLFITPGTPSCLALPPTPADLDRWRRNGAMGNYVRIAVVLTLVILVIASLVRISRDTAPAQSNGGPAHTRAFDAGRKKSLESNIL